MTERMDVLHQIACYADALNAATPEAFIAAISPHWSTDPNRAAMVLEIYNGHLDILAPQKKTECST
jgi:hypothetical protein